MAGMAFDRRRANGPEITYPPLYDIFVSNDKQKTPLWSLDEHQLLLDPKSLPAQDLCLHDISLGADNLPISRIVRKDSSEREEGRAPLEFRKMCAYFLIANHRLANWYYPKCKWKCSAGSWTH